MPKKLFDDEKEIQKGKGIKEQSIKEMSYSGSHFMSQDFEAPKNGCGREFVSGMKCGIAHKWALLCWSGFLT